MLMKLSSIHLALLGIGCGLCALSTTAAAAGEIRISGGDCAQNVRLVAHDARLSDVLDFQLSFESANDPLIDLTATRSPVDLLGLLAPAENLSFTQARDPRCPARERIVKVWVLPNGSKNLVRAAMSPPPPAPDPAAEQARKAREGAEMILKSHGIPTPQPEEQDPDNPEANPN